VLSKERIAELKMYFTRCVQSRSLSTVVHLAECGLELIEMVEALQQENNGWRERYDELDAGHSRLFKDFCKLQQENEQLQAQVAQYREALIIANHRMPDVGQFCACGKCKTCGADINYVGYEHCVKCARVIIDEALSDTPADYHNPADVEALRKAREVVRALNQADWCDCDHCKGVREAIAAIDKIGGWEDD
jgi:predicted nuclease with TOPRIM domain